MFTSLALADHHDLFRPPAVLEQIDASLLPPLFKDRLEIFPHPALHLVGQDDGILDIQVPKLGLVVHAIPILMPDGHTLALNRLDKTMLDHLSLLASQANNVSIQMRKISRPIAKQRLAQRQDLPPVEIIILAPEKHAIHPVGIILLETGLLLDQRDDQIARHIIRVRIRLVLIHNPHPVRHAPLHGDRHGRRLPEHPLALAVRALVLDHLAASAALVALHLHLLEHAGRQLVAHNLDAVAPARVARLDVAVGRARAAALFADLLLLPGEFCRGAVVEVAQRDADFNFEVLAAAVLLAKVAAAAEEAAEDVKGVVRVAAAALLLVLLEPFVAVLVVDAAGFGVDEGFVGFRYFDELVMGCVVASVKGEGVRIGVGGGKGGRKRTGSCLGGISCLIVGRQT